MRQLPLVPPTSEELLGLAVLAVLTAETCETTNDVQNHVRKEQASYTQQGLTWTKEVIHYVMIHHLMMHYLIITLIVYGAVKAYDPYDQTTYTEVRGAAQPRFRVLPEHRHG